MKDERLSRMWSSAVAREARALISRGDCPGGWVECEAYREIVRDKMGLLGTALKAMHWPGTAGIS